jgi:hypothetical protein
MSATKHFEIRLVDPAKLAAAVDKLPADQRAQLEAQWGGPFDLGRANAMLSAIAQLAGLSITIHDPGLRIGVDRETGAVALTIDDLGPHHELVIIDIHLHPERAARWAAELTTATEGN